MEAFKIGQKNYEDFESFGRRCGCPRPSFVRRRQLDAKMREFVRENSAKGHDELNRELEKRNPAE